MGKIKTIDVDANAFDKGVQLKRRNRRRGYAADLLAQISEMRKLVRLADNDAKASQERMASLEFAQDLVKDIEQNLKRFNNHMPPDMQIDWINGLKGEELGDEA